jgi:hypothetical protein
MAARYEIRAARSLLERLGTGPAQVSPWAARVEAYVQEWVVASGLVVSPRARDRFRRTAPGDLAARVYASAIDGDRLETATMWIAWLFLIDDQFDEGETGKDPLLIRQRLSPWADMAAVMATGTAADQGAEARRPLLAALGDIWRRLAHMSASWREAFASHYTEYLRGCEWEAGNRLAGRIPSRSEFARKRREAGAIWPSLDLLEYVTAEPMSASYRGDPLLTAIRTACADVVCWTDDLLTAEKERAHGDVHNLAFVLECATGCDERKALEMVAELIAARLSDFEELRSQLPAAGLADGMLTGYVEGLRHWMRGHLEWGLHTMRYTAGSGYLEDLLD